MKDLTIPTSKLSLKGARKAVGSALHNAADAVVNAKTPSLKEVSTTANNAQKSLRHKLAQLIDSE